MAKIVSEETNLRYLEVDSTQLQVIRSNFFYNLTKNTYFSLIYLRIEECRT